MHRERSALSITVPWLAVVLWAGIIWWGMTLPSENTPDLGFIPMEDKLAHAAVHGIWGFLICWAADRSLRFLSRTGISLAAVLATAAYATVSEIHQAGIGRDADVFDGLAGVAGSIVACLVYFSPKSKRLLDKLTARADRYMMLRRRRTNSLTAQPPSESEAAEESRPQRRD
jgi:VanZ family protein